MVIVDIKLLSGFTADTSLLGSSPQTFAPLVERVDAGDDSVLVYLKEVMRLRRHTCPPVQDARLE
ncbi:hypothetical protein DPX16_0002 [Anabarilius grahami]|uniref:Alpha-macroglobulin receptor-binding domain-containing protein n=1 Tax=Anabarilius grahami TaxID=495550 RepID=A0A3N0YJP9_ANAGA|nr:hypothetical protein DPX16_0002 [Anabarilius grahami]